MTTGMVERAVLNDAEADALRVLANIYIGTPDCHIRREDANALINYMSRLENERSELRSALTAGERLAAFGAAVLEESRDDLCDLDGGWLQEKAVELGVLVEVPVTEACDESTCRCAEYGFPTTCYRYAPEVCAAMEKANG